MIGFSSELEYRTNKLLINKVYFFFNLCLMGEILPIAAGKPIKKWSRERIEKKKKEGGAVFPA